jgi:type VI secretion system secreted protein VgrG
MTFSQADRMIRIATPLGENTFGVLSFSGVEEISEMFSFEMQLASERPDIIFDQVAGQNVTVAIRSSDGGERFFHGIIVAFEPTQISLKEGYSTYTAVLAPALWPLTQCFDSRIFQHKSVPDIIRAVLGQSSLSRKQIRQEIVFRMDLAADYPAREYCVQYNESDTAFISRLCESEGIYYFFHHENGRHTLVFADAPEKHPPFAEGPKQTIIFQSPLGGALDREVVTGLVPTHRLTAGKYTARDYNFILPDNDLTVQKSSQNSTFNVQGESYEYPGGYETTNARGQTLARVRMEAIDARLLILRGRGNCRAFAPGFKFKLDRHVIESMNGREYVLTKVRHEARQEIAPGAAAGDSYHNSFQCLPAQVPFRPERRTPKPVIAGSQTAIVTGPEGEEIHTDKYGRVKVRFAWDRNLDEKARNDMSCWIRVSQTLAGAKFGAMYIPRVGQEVVVNFLEGDPDHPLITGRVYHGKNLPPYDLPAQKTKSTVKTNSSKNGNGNSNEIMFEDLSGSEMFFTHAAKDRSEVVENDKITEVKNNQALKVKNDLAVTVSDGHETHAVESGGRQVSVKAEEKHSNAADFIHKVGGGYTLKVKGDITIDAGGIVRITGAKVILN